jgi:hypothetical protein
MISKRLKIVFAGFFWISLSIGDRGGVAVYATAMNITAVLRLVLEAPKIISILIRKGVKMGVKLT